MLRDKNARKYFNQCYENLVLIEVPLKFSVPHKKIRDMVEKIVSQSKSIIDLGCGFGTTLRVFEKFNNNAKLTGVDCSDEALKINKKLSKYIKNIELIEADLNKYVLPKNKYDMVFCSQLLEHIANPDRFLKNIYRSLHKDGNLVLATVLRSKNAWYIYKNAKGKTALAPDHINEYEDIDRLRKELSKNGFKIKAQGVSVFRYPIIDVVIKFLQKYIQTKTFIDICNSRLMMEFRYYVSVPIVGFYNIQIIATKNYE